MFVDTGSQGDGTLCGWAGPCGGRCLRACVRAQSIKLAVATAAANFGQQVAHLPVVRGE